MKKIPVILLTVLFILFNHFAVADTSSFDFSTMSNDELTALIDAAQSELDSRSSTAGTQANKDKQETIGIDNTLYVREARLVVQSEDYKALYPDVLQAILFNNTEYDIQDVVVAFMAWDENNLPVLIKGQFDFNSPTYVRQGTYSGINMIPGSTYGEQSGMKIDESVKGITTVKAIVVSYKTFDGNEWTNPDYESFVEKYAGKKLS